MRLAVGLTFDVPRPDCAVEILTAVDPPSLPHFDEQVRIVVGTEVNNLVSWLDEGEVR